MNEEFLGKLIGLADSSLECQSTSRAILYEIDQQPDGRLQVLVGRQIRSTQIDLWTLAKEITRQAERARTRRSR